MNIQVMTTDELAGQCACIQMGCSLNKFGCWCTDPVSPIGQVLEVCSLMVTEHGTIFIGTSNIAGASVRAASSPVREARNACVDRRQPWAQSPPALKAL